MPAPWEEYASTAPTAPWEEYGTVKKPPMTREQIAAMIANDPISQGARSFAGQGSDALGGVSQAILNGLGGFVRGAGSIGATLARPFESAQDNADRRAGIDANMRAVGAQPDSFGYGAGKLGAEVAGTAGVGGAAANALRAAALPMASSLPAVNAISGIARGLETGGFRVGPLTDTAAILARIGTGAATGGAAAGMVNPADAGTGAVIGGVLPVGVQLAGKAGAYLRGAGSQINPEITDTARRSMEAGYVIPPSQVNPSFRNRAIESLSGKYETAQMASTRNQQLTDDLVRKSLGLPEGAPLTQQAMDLFRKQQYQAGYEPVKQFGMIPVGQRFNDALDGIASQYTGKGTIPAMAQDKKAITDLVNSHKSTGFDSADAIDAIRGLRESADESFRKGDNALGKAYKAIANTYEGAIDDALSAAGQGDLLGAYRAARQNIAKSFTVEKGLREGAGTVDARALARELQKGKPLSGDLRTVAEFGNVFNKAAQPPHLIGSPAVNALKPMLSLATSGVGGAALGPAGIGLGALNYVLPPVARSYMFSPAAQRSLLGSGTALLDEAAPLGLLTQGAYRALPLVPAQ